MSLSAIMVARACSNPCFEGAAEVSAASGPLALDGDASFSPALKAELAVTAATLPYSMSAAVQGNFSLLIRTMVYWTRHELTGEESSLNIKC